MSDVIEFDEQDCLDCDPFEGDYGGSGLGDGVLKDKFVKATKHHEGKCHHCRGDVHKGERHRYRVEVYDGDMETSRWCRACCSVLARLGSDDLDVADQAQEEYEKRAELNLKEPEA